MLSEERLHRAANGDLPTLQSYFAGAPTQFGALEWASRAATEMRNFMRNRRAMMNPIGGAQGDDFKVSEKFGRKTSAAFHIAAFIAAMRDVQLELNGIHRNAFAEIRREIEGVTDFL